MHAIAPEAHNSYPFFGERGMLHRQLASASVRTALTLTLTVTLTLTLTLTRCARRVPASSSVSRAKSSASSWRSCPTLHRASSSLQTRASSSTGCATNRLRRRASARKRWKGTRRRPSLRCLISRTCAGAAAWSNGNGPCPRSQQPMRPHLFLQEPAASPVPRSGP